MKRLLFTMVLFAAAMSGCAKNEINEVLASDSTDAIKLNTSVSATRGADTDNDAIETSNDVKLYVEPASGDAYSLAYTYDSSSSSWSTSSDNSTWSDVGFTSSFYSAHDGSAQTLTVGDGSATLGYTVTAGETSATKDLVYFGTEISSMPVGGNIYAYFKHALSKLNFSSSVSTEKVYIASIKLMNVDGVATLTINEDGTIAWSDNDDSYTSDYTYYTASAASNDNNAMMMIPQSTSASEYVTDGYSDTYIEVIYYLTDASGNPLVGFANASKFKVGNSVIDVDNSSLDSDDPLYVKVAFPMQYDFDAATQYNIALSFNSTSSTGGYILTDSYVNASGDAITLYDADNVAIPFPQAIGDPAITSSNTAVGLIIDTVEWGTEVESFEPEGEWYTGVTKSDTIYEVTAPDYIFAKSKNSGDYADGGILEVTYTTTLDLSYTVTPSSIFTDKMIKYVEEDLGIDFDYYNVEQTESYSVLVSTEATKAPMEDLGTDPLAYYEVTANPVVYEYVFTTVLGDVEFRLSYDELTVGFCSEYMLINDN